MKKIYSMKQLCCSNRSKAKELNAKNTGERFEELLVAKSMNEPQQRGTTERDLDNSSLEESTKKRLVFERKGWFVCSYSLLQDIFLFTGIFTSNLIDF